LALTLLLLPMLLLGARGAAAQGLSVLSPPAAAAAAKPASAPSLTPAETHQMIELLNDPQKRAAFTATLETLAKAQTVVAPPKQAAAAAAVPLAPDSVGAQLLREGTAWISSLSGQLASFGRVLGDLPSVWAFTLRTVQDPVLRMRALDTGWRLAVVLAASLLAEWAVWRLLRRPMINIAAHAPDHAEPHAEREEAIPSRVSARVEARVLASEGELDPALIDAEASPDADPPAGMAAAAPADGAHEDGAHEDAVVAHVLRGRRFARAVRTLKRLPFVLLCFLLDLLPLGIFLAVGYAGALFVMPQIRAVLQAALLAYGLCRLATSITRALVSPELPRLRLAHVSDQGAAYALVWVRRIFAVGAFGYAASQIGQLFGLPAAANDAFLKAVFLIVHLFLIIIVLQCRASVAQRIRSHSATPTVGSRIRNRIAAIWHLVAIFYIAALWMVWAAEVRHGYLRIWHIFLVTVAVLIVARLVGIMVLGGLDRALRISPDASHRYPGLEQRANRYVPLLRSAVSGLLVVITCLALLQAWGVNTLAWFHANALGGKLVSASITILVAAAIAVAVWEAANASLDRHLAHLTRQGQIVKSARLRTLMPILRTTLLTCLVAIFGLTALSEIGVNIAPLLAGAGILGVAIGFGSQKLVQDFITGIFLLLENAMQVGDWVTVAGLSGSVEHLSIRTMRLRAGDGSVHIIPFSSVSTVTNVNRGIGNAAVSVNVPIEEDSDHVSEILTEIAREMRGERGFSDMMRSDFQLWGVDKVDAGVVTIVGQIVCTDSGRWAVQREFNRRMNIRFKQLGIRVATPVQTVYNHVAKEPAKPAPPRKLSGPPASQLQESPPPAALGNTS
jgi:small-conductance mechanosensitive channel